MKEFIDYLLDADNNPSEGSIIFDSTDHVRFQNGRDVSGHNYGCHRRVVIENNIQGGEGYTVTIYNMDTIHPMWGNNVQMAPKPMKIINVERNVERTMITLRGFGFDERAILMGVPRQAASFADYGISLMVVNGSISYAQLHMYDRNVCIVYYQQT